MKMSSLCLFALFSLPLAACHDGQTAAKPAAATTPVAATAPAPTTTAAATAPAAPTAAAAVGDDPAVPKLAVGTAAKCPVSGEDFTVTASTAQVTYNGKRYAFCCPDCQPTFAKNPAKYAKN